MARLLMLTSAPGPGTEVLPALALLPHAVRILPPEPSALVVADDGDVEVVVVDARHDLVAARSLCQMLRTTGLRLPLLAVLTEGGLAALSSQWGVDDVLLDTAGPAEVDARLRVASGRSGRPEVESARITRGDVEIDEDSYSASVGGRLLDLTYKEFELLKHLAQHPGRVFTRSQLLQEVWGYDYYGGTRTIDVHVRRLRAKLGSDHEVLIGTVRNVGYRFVADTPDPPAGGPAAGTPPHRLTHPHHEEIP